MANRGCRCQPRHYDRAVESTRDRLVEAATELLDAGGPAAVTLREVGRRAGVSHNAPYKHFADKEELLAAIAARELANQQRGVRHTKDEHPVDRLRAMMHGYVRWATRHPARFKLTFGAWSTDSAELASAASAARSALVTTVAAAQQAKQLPEGDPERVAALVLAVTHGAVDLALSGHLARKGKGHADPHDLVDDLIEHLQTRTGSMGHRRRSTQ
jgi:AcrR family transcriptional regulator